MKVTDEMVEAACSAVSGFPRKETVRAALEAALAARPAAQMPSEEEIARAQCEYGTAYADSQRKVRITYDMRDDASKAYWRGMARAVLALLGRRG